MAGFHPGRSSAPPGLLLGDAPGVHPTSRPPQASPGPRDLEEAPFLGLHRPLFWPDPPPPGKRWRKRHLFGGVRCKVVGEWGGSAH